MRSAWDNMGYAEYHRAAFTDPHQALAYARGALTAAVAPVTPEITVPNLDERGLARLAAAYLDDIPFIDCDDSGMPTVNVSTEYDWARFLWAMNQEGMTVAQIADVVALSSPDFWGNEPPTNFHPAALLQGAVDEYDLTHTPDWGPTWSGLASDHAVDR
ncbi:MAG: hypothetical protein ABMA64_18270 [Myxococcota bacterium]